MEPRHIEELISQSDKSFREQFDPNSENFHNGSTQTVPTGGQRVPESMPQEYPENFNPGETGPTSEQLGPDYIKLQSQREIITNMKKVLARQSALVQAVFRHNEHFHEKADKSNPQHLEKHKANIEKQEAELKTVNTQLAEMVDTLIGLGGNYKEFQKQLDGLIKDSLKHYETKEELTDFGFKNKKLSTKIFADTKKLLEQMKTIKKNYKKPEAAKTE